MTLRFEWDENKAIANMLKHGVSFDEAKSIFDDSASITINDPKHSLDEERFVDIGLSSKGRVLVVVYTARNDKIRIISCRTASVKEQRMYEQSSF